MTTEGLSVQNYHFDNSSKTENIIGFFSFILIATVLFFSFFWAKDFLRFGSIPEPSLLSVTNISNQSFTVTWKTTTSANGYILYGRSPESLYQKAYDNKVMSEKILEYETKEHTVTLTNLNPDTYYYYKIVSEGKHMDSIDGELFEPVRTALLSPFFDAKK